MKTCRVFDPDGTLLPWRTVTDAAGRRRELCIVHGRIFERVAQARADDLVRVSLAVAEAMRTLAQEAEASAMGLAAGEAGPQGQGPQPAGSAAGEDTPPAGRGPIEAGGSEPRARSRPQAGPSPVEHQYAFTLSGANALSPQSVAPSPSHPLTEWKTPLVSVSLLAGTGRGRRE